MLRALLHRVAAMLPARFIDHNGKPYLERHYLCTILNTRVYLHRFVDSDPDGLHNHPFLKSCSFIIAGWYFEHKPDNVVNIKRWFNKIGPEDFHRIVLPDNGKDVWTIFFHSPRVRPWGFLRKATPESEPDLQIESAPNDPAFSTWHLTAPTADVLRRTVRHIPCGLNLKEYLKQSSN